MPIPLEKIAHDINAQISGNSSLTIQDPTEVSFIEKKSDLLKISSPVRVALISKSMIPDITESPETSSQVTWLCVEHPRISFAKVLELFDRPKDIKPGIDPRSWVEAGAEIDPSSVIYPFVSIRRGVKIGKKVVLYPGVYVGEDSTLDDDSIAYPNSTIFRNTQIGKRVILHAGSIVGDDGYGYVWDGKCHYKIPQVGKVVIEDDVELGSNSAIDRATTGETRIKKGTKIDNLVQIGHNVQIGEHSILCGQVGIAGSCTIGRGSMLGGQVGLADHVKLGPNTKVAAQSGVRTNTQAGETIMGYPAQPFKEFFRSVSIWQKLPELQATIKKLEREVEELKRMLKK